MLENSDNTVHLRDYFKVIRNRLWVIVTIFLLTVVSGYYVTEQVLPRYYTAKAEIDIAPRGETTVVGMVPVSTPDKPFDTTKFQSEMEKIQSSSLLEPLITDLNLDKTWAKRDFKLPIDKLPMLKAMEYMQHKVLKVDFKRGTEILEITAQSQDPEEAATIANAVVGRYKTLRGLEQDEKSASGVDELIRQIADQQKVVDEKKKKVDDLREKLGLSDADLASGDNIGTTTRDEQALDQLRRDLQAAKVEADAQSVLQKQVQTLSDDAFVNTMEAMGHQQESIGQLRKHAFELESNIENLLQQGFEQNHPHILALKAELDSVRQQIKDVIAGMHKAIDVNAEMSKSRVAMLSGEVDELQKKVTFQQTNLLSPFREALLDYKNERGILDVYNIHLKQIQMDRQLYLNPVTIITPAAIPTSPSSPNFILNMAVSIVAGLFFGVVVAFLIEYLDTSVKTMADAEQLLGLPVLSVIPNKGGPMPLTQASARLPHAEGYRILRAKLDLKVQNGIGPSLSVLSGGPGEGKSTTLFNLGIVCAQAGQSVILVDCDLRRPTLHNLLNISNDRGLANYLRGEGDAVEYIQQTAIPTLHAMPAGDMPISEIGVLAGDKIRHMLDDLKQRYDLVLVDSPPVLGISDGSIVAREVDYVILVVQHRRYPREISLRAKRAIEEVHGNCIGMLLNSVTVKSDDSYYYYSNYGKYYKKTDRAKEKKGGRAKANGKPVSVSSRSQEIVDSEEF